MFYLCIFHQSMPGYIEEPTRSSCFPKGYNQSFIEMKSSHELQKNISVQTESNFATCRSKTYMLFQGLMHTSRPYRLLISFKIFVVISFVSFVVHAYCLIFFVACCKPIKCEVAYWTRCQCKLHI
ncbi:hypothetical protein Cni_G26324 [Canna indica]|uniref:Uncharacterized protein n=1 Tax=Canna indica TaxID=4628 RepID=A0AAQ3L3I1_9LILI|nr:hypothetical protein Cni_G26324 [Canna indica]